LKGSSRLLESADGETLSHAEIVLVVTMMDAAKGRPETLGVEMAATSACAKAVKLAYKAKRGERGQPLKPLSRVRDELEVTLIGADFRKEGGENRTTSLGSGSA
jgi:hypothetical protein